MKLSVIAFVILALSFRCFAQEISKNDSLHLNNLQPTEEFLSVPLFLSDPVFTPDQLQYNTNFFRQPLFPENRWKIDTSILNKDLTSSSFSLNPYSLTGYPFLSTLSILSQASYQLSNKFTIGGNSFAGNSIFNPNVPLNPSISNMNVKGASFFMQYKISPKVKIETRVSISNNPYPTVP